MMNFHVRHPERSEGSANKNVTIFETIKLTDSINMKYTDYIAVEQPTLVDSTQIHAL